MIFFPKHLTNFQNLQVCIFQFIILIQQINLNISLDSHYIFQFLSKRMQAIFNPIKMTKNYFISICFAIFIFTHHFAYMNGLNSNASEPLIKSEGVKYNDYEFISKIVVNICWAAAYSGYCLGYFNTINFDDTIKIFDIQADRALMQGSLSFCIAAGAGFGGYYAKEIISRFSRRQSFLFVGLIAIVATLLLQTKIVPIIFACRIVQGITVGVSTVIRSTYIKQFVPLQLAGKFGTLNQVFFAIGLIFTFALAYVLSLFLPAESYWRVIYICPVLFVGLQAYNFIYKFPYQTPKYLLQKNRKEEAQKLIRIIYKAQFVEQRMNDLLKHISISQLKQDQEMAQIQTIKPTNGESQKKTLTSNKIAVYIAYRQSSLQQISGIQVIILYAGEIMLSIQPSLQKIVPLIMQILGFAASLFAMKYLDSYGRKALLQFGYLSIGIMHFIIAICFWLQYKNGDSNPTASLIENVMIVAGLLLCRWTFSMTLGPITWLYLPEIVEPEITGVATMINWVAAALVAFIYPIVVELAGNPSTIFLIFGLSMVWGYATNRKWMVESKNKPEWQIRSEYDELLKHW